MLHIEAIVLIAVNLIFISQVSGFNLDKAKKAFKAKGLSYTDGGNCKNIKCATEEYVCAKLRTNLYFSHITMVIKKCKLEYMKCNEGVEAIELPMKYCRQKQTLDNARKASPNEKTKEYLNMGITRTHRRSKRSPDIATKTPKNILASKMQRKRLANKKPKIDYSSLYFGPKSRKDADAESSAEGEQKKETGNRNQDIDEDQFAPEKREKISLMFSPNGKNRNVEVPNDEGDGQEESPKRNQEVNTAEAADDSKAISLTIQTNNANRGVQDGEGDTSKESANRNQEVDPGDGTANEGDKISLSLQKNNANGGVEDESGQNKESANRNQEVESEDGSTNDEKRVAIMIETNAANRGVEVTKSAETDNTNRGVDVLKGEEEASKESANRDLEVNPDNEDADVDQRQKIHLVIETNNDLPVTAENDDSNKARDVTMEALNDKENADSNDSEANDDDGNKVVLMIDPNNGNRGVENNEEDVDETENDKNRDVALDEDGGQSEDQAVKPKAVNAGDDDEQTAREVALEEENGISGENENREELKDNEENDDNETNVIIESPDKDGIDVILETGGGDETLGGPEEDNDKNVPNRLEDISEGADDGMQQRKENKDKSVEDLSSLEGGKKAPDYEDVDIDEYKKDCPSVCPARDVMVCARCKEGVYRTFLSICHLRMFNCKHPEEKLELVGRRPCMMSAPFMNDMPKPKGRVSEPGDTDNIWSYYRCKGKAGLNDPKCKRRAANEEAQKRRYKI